MAEKRMIASGMITDEFYISLSLLGRQLWVGIIIAAADDQGRFQDIPALIRSTVFPADDIEISAIEEQINIFIREGKLYRYTKSRKKLLQIVNWWKYQNHQYPAESKYEAPDGWTDRVRRKISDKEQKLINWDKPGGFEIMPEINSYQENTNDDTSPDSCGYSCDDTSPDSCGYTLGFKNKNKNKNKNIKSSFSGEKERGQSPRTVKKYVDAEAEIDPLKPFGKNKELAEAFMIASGLKPIGKEHGLWNAALKQIAEAGITAEEIPRVVEYMRRENLTIGSPKSILNVGRDLKASGKINGNPDSWQFSGSGKSTNSTNERRKTLVELYDEREAAKRAEAEANAKIIDGTFTDARSEPVYGGLQTAGGGGR